MAKSVLCLKCCKGRWTEDDSEPDTQTCKRCQAKWNGIYNRGNFYEVAKAILTPYIDLGKPTTP